MKTKLLIAFIAIINSPFVIATADGPDFFQSREGITQIKVYEKPRISSQLLQSLDAPISGLRNIGCKDEGSLKSKFKNEIWCKIAYQNTEGWVQNKDLAEDSQSKQPSYNCAQAKSEIETLICNYQELIALDNSLQKIYDQALAKASNIDDRPKKAVQELKTTQRGWIKGRDDCWKALENKFQCIKLNYEQRQAFLQAKWILLTPTSTKQYFCESNRAEFTLTFFPTKPIASVSVEYGDKTKIFLQSDKKNHNRYDGDFGAYFELKGKEGLFVWEESTSPLKCLLNKVYNTTTQEHAP